MNQSYRVVLGEDNDDHQVILVRAIERLGHSVIGVEETGKGLVERCLAEHPDLIITDIRMPDMDGLEAAKQIYERSAIPTIVVTSQQDPELVERALNQQILAFLIKPIDETQLQPAIAIVMRRFAEFEALRKENESLSQTLADRKVIEKAKGILMKRAGLGESEAFRRLQSTARDQRKKIVEVAQTIVDAESLMKPE